jgi:serine/threonine protein phosphatase 1
LGLAKTLLFRYSKAQLGKIIVHGHTPAEKPEILRNRINIDTGAGRNGQITAIELPSLRIWQQW